MDESQAVLALPIQVLDVATTSELHPAHIEDGDFTFLTNNALVLIQISRDPRATVRTIAQRVGITERGTHKILRQLIGGGYVVRRRIGARNHYIVNPHRTLYHANLGHLDVTRLLEALI